VWTSKKVALAREVSFLAGGSASAHLEFTFALRIVYLYGIQVDETMDLRLFYNFSLSYIANEEHRRGSFVITLTKAVFRSMIRACFDPRDKIFGVVSTVRNPDARKLVNYNHPITKVFEEATVFTIREENGIGLLNINKFDKPITGLPSWVLDWSLCQMRSPSHSKYEAAKDIVPCVLSCIDGEISLQGLILDKISKIYE
jgi:hypothetical protein